jgi:hypothetical protein
MDDSRRQEIMRQLAHRQHQRKHAPQRAQQNDLAQIINDVDAWGKLEQLTGARALKRRCFGPQAARGFEPTPWVGVVIWCKGQGYYGFKELTLLGIWALPAHQTVRLIMGEKILPYAAPTYEAGAYHKIIQRHFDLYYQDDGHPPETPIFSVDYDSAQRLQIRAQLRDELNRWLKSVTHPQ